MTIKVLLADDQALVRGALAALLSLEPDIEVVAEVGRGDEVVAAVESSGAEVALLDIEMPGMTGLEVAGDLRAKGVACRSLIVTTFGRAGYVRRALEAGASGFVVKDTPAAELAEASVVNIRTTMATNFTLTAEMVEAHVTPRSKILVIINPNNPTGTVTPPDEVARIAEVANYKPKDGAEGAGA